MNVGSILNEEPTAGNKNGKKPTAADQKETDANFQRHSIVNLLNESPTKTQERKRDVSTEPEGNVSTSSNNDEDIKLSSNSDGVNKLGHDNTNGTNEKIVNSSDENTLQVGEDYETKKLGKLKASSKPRRYKTPPVWAQEWNPFKPEGYSPVPSNNEASTLSGKHVFDQSLTVSADLECSITGVIPPPSLTRTIAEWIYANFTEIPNDQRKYVELELKFGTIMDKRTGQRIDISVSTECIFTDASNTYFDMGVHEVGWNDMRLFLEDLEKRYQDDLRRSADNKVPKRKFNTLETDTTDMFFQISNRNEQPKSIRISKDNTLVPPRYSAIHKQRISSLFIYNPSSMYDLRLSLSLELPIPGDQVDAILKKNQPTLTRIKKRNSWSHRPTVTRFDMTKVLIPRELKNKSGKKIVEQDQSFEVELEIDVLELFNGFDQFKNGIDSIRFEELVEIFMNNARCLNNRVTKLAMNR